MPCHAIPSSAPLRDHSEKQTIARSDNGPGAARKPQGREWLGDIGFLAVLLAALGAAARHLLRRQEPDRLVGFAHLDLLSFLLLTRGRGLAEFTIGKEGVPARLEAALARAEQAAELAARAKSAADQPAAQPAAQSAQPMFDSAAIVPPLAPADMPCAESMAEIAARVTGRAAPDDPQKNQWGGQPIRSGQRLSAKVIPRPGPANTFDVHLRVEPEQGSPPIATPVWLHLHSRFVPQTPRIQPAEGAAHLDLVAWGAFTVGATVEDEPQTFLEIDLAGLPEAQEQFRSR